MFNSLLGKYRFLVVSISLFLIFDLGVLVLNFYTSGKIAEQAELINLAARQRTLTQQMSKATLYIKAQKLKFWVYESGLDELREYYNTFDSTLAVFNHGGVFESTDSGLPITVEAVESERGLAILAEANALWAEFAVALDPLMVDTLVTDDEIRPASDFIATNNTRMFALMDDLTLFFKQSAERQTALLRRAQIVGISLATINFFIILLHFIGQLRVRDRKIQVKQHESDQILSTISEGIFLLDERLVIGGQHSKQLEDIFSTKRISGYTLKRFLSQYFPGNTVETAVDFVKLYFREHIDPELIEDVNPLKHVKASVVLSSGETVSKYLDFSFARLNQASSEQASILVTVHDVTASILLEKQDQQASDELSQQMSLLTQILPIPRQDLDGFIHESSQGYDRVNALLKGAKHVEDSFENTLVRIAREIHKLKGGAAALSLGWMVDQYHQIEDDIQALCERSRIKKLNGRELLPLTIKLKKQYDNLDLIIELRDKLGRYNPIVVAQNDATFASTTDMKTDRLEAVHLNSRWYGLCDFAQRLASDEKVSVALNLRGFDTPLDPRISAKLYPIAVQLVRNSIAHGIETTATRFGLRKPDIGQITITISSDQKGNYRFLYEDDGRGFDYEGIRQDLVSKGLMKHEDAKALDRTELVRCAFADAVSTRVSTDKIAGRGAGLPLVWQQLKLLAGQLKIRSVKYEFTQFIIDFRCATPSNTVIGTPDLEKAS